MLMQKCNNEVFHFFVEYFRNVFKVFMQVTSFLQTDLIRKKRKKIYTFENLLLLEYKMQYIDAQMLSEKGFQ